MSSNVSRADYNRMSPRERENYLAQQAEAGVDNDSWLFGEVQKFIARVGAEDQAHQMSSDYINSADAKYVQGLHASDSHYPGIEHDALFSYANDNNEPGQVQCHCFK